jgi:hypothetical protein
MLSLGCIVDFRLPGVDFGYMDDAGCFGGLPLFLGADEGDSIEG